MALMEVNACWLERTGDPNMPTGTRTLKKKEEEKSKPEVFIETAVKHLNQCRYSRLIKLLKTRNGYRKAWLVDIQKIIRKEMLSLHSDKTLFSHDTSRKHDYQESEWDEILDKIKITAPVLFTICFSAMTTSDTRKKKRLHRSRLGMMFLIPLHHRKPGVHKIPKYLPLSFASTLFRKQFPLGLHHRKPVAPVRKDVNITVKSWQASIQQEESSMETDTPIAGTDMNPGYSLVINSRSSKSKYGVHTVCDAFAVKNRVSFRELQDDTTVKASDLPLKTYLPSQTDYEELRMRMRIVVERILKANLDLFSDQSPLEHIPHQYSNECSQKSEYVNVEIGEDDDAYDGDDDNEKGRRDAQRVLRMLNKLSQLIPAGYDTPLHADEESMKMIRSARRDGDPTRRNHQHQLHPVPQDLRGVIVKDMIADLFTPTQASEKGTLRHLKVFFGHNSVNEEVSSFKHTEEFLLFITCAFVVGFGMEILQKSKPCRPMLGPVADEIVRRIWHQLPMNRVADILNAPVKDHDDQFCFCKEDIGEVAMVECCNVDCPHGRWFHQNCVLYMNVDGEGDWFCSPECAQSNMGLFCICRQKREVGTDLTWSCANDSCQRGERFHHQCVRSTLPVNQDDDWYCSAECTGEEERDQFLDYIQRVTWCSLFSECIRDAEREGDGLASIAYWRISMPELFARGHVQHVAATHRLLAGTSGCFPSRVREEVIHNRTINLQGGQGNNVSLDFMAEQLDIDSAARALVIAQAKNSKSKRKAIKLHQEESRFARHHDDVAKFIDKFGDMFREMKGRIVPSICHKIVGQEITQKQATEMKKSLLKLNKNFDEELMTYHSGSNT